MAKKIILPIVAEPVIVEQIKPIKIKKIKKVGVEIPPVVMEAIVINDVVTKPKRILSDEQKLKMKLGRIKSLEAKKTSK